MPDTIPVFDGHNDVLLRLVDRPEPEAAFLTGTADGHLDLPRARTGGLVGGFFAIFPPSPASFDLSLFAGGAYDVPLPPELEPEIAARSTVAMLALMLRIERASSGAVTVCRTRSEIRQAVQRGSLAAVIHVEGAEAIGPDLAMLDVLHAAGLRSLGPVWSRPNGFGHGVPFRFPGSPDTGPGLTDAGKDLVRACNRLGVQIDVSHLNEEGFWDVARLSKAPLVATHSNVHALCPSARNLTDRQLDAIRDSDGLVGLNFATGFLRADGGMQVDTDLDWMARHLDALLERLGERRVGLGSDFDGAVIPAGIGDVAGLSRLFDALRARGFDEVLLRRIGSENWLDLIERTIG